MILMDVLEGVSRGEIRALGLIEEDDGQVRCDFLNYTQKLDPLHITTDGFFLVLSNGDDGLCTGTRWSNIIAFCHSFRGKMYQSNDRRDQVYIIFDMPSEEEAMLLKLRLG
jgi:hypothetical protein